MAAPAGRRRDPVLLLDDRADRHQHFSLPGHDLAQVVVELGHRLALELADARDDLSGNLLVVERCMRQDRDVPVARHPRDPARP